MRFLVVKRGVYNVGTSAPRWKYEISRRRRCLGVIPRAVVNNFFAGQPMVSPGRPEAWLKLKLRPVHSRTFHASFASVLVRAGVHNLFQSQFLQLACLCWFGRCPTRIPIPASVSWNSSFYWPPTTRARICVSRLSTGQVSVQSR